MKQSIAIRIRPDCWATYFRTHQLKQSIAIRPDVVAGYGGPTDGDLRTHSMKLSIAIRSALTVP